jgi:hypothetical protein
VELVFKMEEWSLCLREIGKEMMEKVYHSQILKMMLRLFISLYFHKIQGIKYKGKYKMKLTNLLLDSIALVIK